MHPAIHQQHQPQQHHEMQMQQQMQRQQMQHMHHQQQIYREQSAFQFNSLGLQAQSSLLDFNGRETSPRFPSMQTRSWTPPLFDFHLVPPLSSMRETSPRFMKPQSWAPPMDFHADTYSRVREKSPSKASSGMPAQSWKPPPLQPSTSSIPSLG